MAAAEALDLPRDLVFVDLETTGGNAAHHRITEVGIVRMQGGAVIEEWSSLVNPECRIPSYIESFTGITNAMVATAPRFVDIAALVLEKLQAPIFVAHNARFDYSFLRSEFRRLDVQFSAKVMCTVKLSRRLFPEFPRHSLDAVMERHRLTCSARHRALGDARVLGDFWCKLRAELPSDMLAAAARFVLSANKLPPHLPQELADELPDGPGVYRFFGEDNVLLYIGKSHSLRSRVLGHFTAEHADAQQQKKARLVRRIDWLETAGDLGAQLIEAQWIKTQRPLFNKRLKARSETVTLQPLTGAAGVRVVAIDELGVGQLDDCFGLFNSRKDARKALTDIARAHGLCSKALQLEQGAGSCMGYQLGKCKGACVGNEAAAMHGLRVQLAVSALKLQRWPFPGRIALEDGRDEYHVFDPWSYVGTARCVTELSTLAATAPARFNVDVYRILVRYLAKRPDVAWRALER